MRIQYIYIKNVTCFWVTVQEALKLETHVIHFYEELHEDIYVKNK